MLKLFQVGVEFESRVTGCEGGYEDVDASVVGLIVLEVSVNDFESFIVGDSALMYVTEGVGDQSEEMGGVVDHGGGGLCRFSPNLPEKLLSMSLAVALRPGFLRMRLVSSLMPSFSWYCRMYRNLSSGVLAQAG